MKLAKVPFCVVFLFFLLLLVRLVLSFQGRIHGEPLQGIAISSNEKIYIGYMQQIDVFDGQVLVSTLNPPTSRAYYLMVENDELIVVTASGLCAKYDLEGNLLGKEDMSNSEYYRLKKEAQRKEYCYGESRYQIKKHMGLIPFEITKNNQTIFRESTLDYLFTGLPFLMFFFLTLLNGFICAVIVTERLKNQGKVSCTRTAG